MKFLILIISGLLLIGCGSDKQANPIKPLNSLWTSQEESLSLYKSVDYRRVNFDVLGIYSYDIVDINNDECKCIIEIYGPIDNPENVVTDCIEGASGQMCLRDEDIILLPKSESNSNSLRIYSQLAFEYLSVQYPNNNNENLGFIELY